MPRYKGERVSDTMYDKLTNVKQVGKKFYAKKFVVRVTDNMALGAAVEVYGGETLLNDAVNKKPKIEWVPATDKQFKAWMKVKAQFEKRVAARKEECRRYMNKRRWQEFKAALKIVRKCTPWAVNTFLADTMDQDGGFVPPNMSQYLDSLKQIDNLHQ